MRENRINIRISSLAFLSFIACLFLFAASPARAQVETNFSAGGGVRIGASTTTCGSGIAGAIRYNAGTGGIDVCDGSTWNVLAPICTNIGDICPDGSIYAGNTVGGAKMFVTDVNQGANFKWKTTNNTDDINPDSDTDGRANNTNRSGSLSLFPAFELCENLARHGRSDWYLPAKDELNTLFLNIDAINASAPENPITGDYWSSTEFPTNDAWVQLSLLGGIQTAGGKTNNSGVRCVRRD